MTIINFASLSSPLEIYRSYFIPNNQILHTILLHWLLDFVPIGLLRVFPFLCSVVLVAVLWKNFSRELGRSALFTSLAALVLSPAFMLYASALRGYMLAALFVSCAVVFGRRYVLVGRGKDLILWFLFGLLASGVMPSALAGMAAAGLYITPYCGKKFWKNRKFYSLAVSPFIGFALFYIPIFSMLVKNFELGEGWHEPFSAIFATAAAVFLTFAVPLVCGIFFHRPHLRNWPRTLIWLLPLSAAVLRVYPFPRVWFVIFPVLALLCAGYLKRVKEKYFIYITVCTLVWGTVCCTPFARNMISPLCSAGGQDDFYAPRFARETFVPSETAGYIDRNFSADSVFVSFNADPWALGLYCRSSKVVFDGPRGKVSFLRNGSAAVFAADEDISGFEKRFGGSFCEIYNNSLHRIYILKK